MNLKLYKCHKEVHACPMTRGEYNKFKGWVIPADEDPQDAGYLVIYNKGTDAEHISWSPKQIFDDGYTEQQETPIGKEVHQHDY